MNQFKFGDTVILKEDYGDHLAGTVFVISSIDDKSYDGEYIIEGKANNKHIAVYARRCKLLGEEVSEPTVTKKEEGWGFE